jgi:cathepsin B
LNPACEDGSKLKFYKAVANSSRLLPNIASIKLEIMTNGPVEAAFNVFEDFFDYSSGVYSH